MQNNLLKQLHMSPAVVEYNMSDEQTFKTGDLVLIKSGEATGQLGRITEYPYSNNNNAAYVDYINPPYDQNGATFFLEELFLMPEKAKEESIKENLNFTDLEKLLERALDESTDGDPERANHYIEMAQFEVSQMRRFFKKYYDIAVSNEDHTQPIPEILIQYKAILA